VTTNPREPHPFSLRSFACFDFIRKTSACEALLPPCHPSGEGCRPGLNYAHLSYIGTDHFTGFMRRPSEGPIDVGNAQTSGSEQR
jgi:hypothetical protein